LAGLTIAPSDELKLPGLVFVEPCKHRFLHNKAAADLMLGPIDVGSCASQPAYSLPLQPVVRLQDGKSNALLPGG
jgi:hypothetical protein